MSTPARYLPNVPDPPDADALGIRCSDHRERVSAVDIGSTSNRQAPTRFKPTGTVPLSTGDRQVIEFCLHHHESRRDTVSIDAILLLDRPADYSEVRI